MHPVNYSNLARHALYANVSTLVVLHIGMHFQWGEFIPKGFGIGTFRKYCRTVAESESEEMSSDEMKEESDSESASETWWIL